MSVQFTTIYYDYKIGDNIRFKCPEEVEGPLASRFCTFHNNNYCVRDKAAHDIRKSFVLYLLKQKVNHAISYSEPLFCIGFQLHDFSLSNLSISKKFTKPVYFNGSQFFGKADFSEAKFQGDTKVRCSYIPTRRTLLWS
jgi:hypothetical protein